MLYVFEWLALIFIFVIGVFAAIALAVFIYDLAQVRDAILHNYPVVGHFRVGFTKLGEFFRQYFFTLDRQEMPFNRAERNWVHKAGKNVDNTSAFGSTRLLSPPGTPIFVNCPFPTLEKDAAETAAIVMGPYCKNPYKAKSFFNISAMSYGAISKPAVLGLSNGARMAGCWLNTGEGGLSTYHLEGGADLVFQIGTAKYGVHNPDGSLCNKKLQEIAAHDQIKMFEIKLSQGAKPGKGGILPAIKVNPEIASIRGIPEFQDSLSPNRHPEIDNVDDILDMINRVRDVTGKPVGIKCVIGAYGWLENLSKAIYARGIESAPDFITVDSGDGGTGAAPMPLMDNVGLPIAETLPMVVDILHQYQLRERIRVVASGKLITPSDVAWAICVGADFVNNARGFMFSLGCIQAMRCNKNTCPTGVTTHKKRLQKGLNPDVKMYRVANYAINMRKEVEVIAHSCGVHSVRDLKRYHVRIIQHNGKSIPLNELYPEPVIVSNRQNLF